MMIPRKLEPEVMDTEREAREYDEMDHSEVNDLFVDDFLAASTETTELPAGSALDVGTGTALIPLTLCRRSTQHQLVAIDLADEMLKLARRNVDRSNFDERIQLVKCDAKRLPFADDSFHSVISNSIIHHIPEPRCCFQEMVRVLQRGGLLFVRDLLRPESDERVEELVTEHTGEETDYSRQLFRQSLHAALTIPEVQNILRELDIPERCVSATSDRHWTVSARL